jgi:hypothetical protein
MNGEGQLPLEPPMDTDEHGWNGNCGARKGAKALRRNGYCHWNHSCTQMNVELRWNHR